MRTQWLAKNFQKYFLYLGFAYIARYIWFLKYIGIIYSGPWKP